MRSHTVFFPWAGEASPISFMSVESAVNYMAERLPDMTYHVRDPDGNIVHRFTPEGKSPDARKIENAA